MKNGQKLPPNTLLRAAREERLWSQSKLAEKIGTTPVNISRWENNKTFPTPYYLQRLSDVFGKTLAELGLLPPSSQDGSRIWNIPTTRNPFFTGREDLLALLLKRLSASHVAALTQSQAQALFGLGGIGKTQTAAEFAFRYGDNYTHVFWMRAATHESLVADYVSLAESLEIPEKGAQDQRRIINAVKRWLVANDGWLLIMDNADDLKMAQEFLPTHHKGYVLFTTRAQASGQIAASMEVEKLNLQDGTLLLLCWSKRLNAGDSIEKANAEDRAAAERIVQEMDGLPLALVQAGAYVDETGCSLADYLRLFATHRKELLLRPASLWLDYPDTVGTTWSLSFKHIEQQSPAAADVLRLCAFLAPDAIPEELFERGATELAALPGIEDFDSYKLNVALAVLRKYSLVRRDGNTNMLSIHRLVQAVLKESMDEQTRSVWAERTVRVINAAFPENEQDTGIRHQIYLPHIQECATLINEYHLYFAEAAQLLFRAGINLYHRGFYPQSQALHQQALAIREETLGPDDPDVAESLNKLGMLSRIQNDFEQAERFHKQALAIRQKRFGMEHSSTVESLNNLGVLYRTQGKYEQAEPYLKQAVDIYKRLQGPEDPGTLMALLNLGKLYTEQRDYKQAEMLLQQALTTCEQALQPGNPIIAHNLNLLAKLYFEQGIYEQAEDPATRSLAIIKEIYGPEHPITAERLYDLAELYFAQGRYAQAQSLCQRALSIFEKTFGAEYPDTIAYGEFLTRILKKKEEKQDDDNPPASPPL